MILSHERPDGDALGSMAALGALLRAMGKETRAYVFGEIPRRYELILKGGGLEVWPESAPIDFSFDGIVIVDTCTLGQLGPAKEIIQSRRRPILAIDHHVTREDLADAYLVDESASSTCLIIAEWAWAVNRTIDPPIAKALFSGMATDTGWFRFPNTDSRTLAAAAALIALGVNPSELYRAIHWSDSCGRVRLMGRALCDMELHLDGRVAAMTIDEPMLQSCGASPSDTEDLVNEPMRIGSVDSSVLFLTQPNSPVKISLRSKGLADVSKVAQRFGGGGHRLAAGVRMEGDIGSIKQAILQAVAEQLGRGQK